MSISVRFMAIALLAVSASACFPKTAAAPGPLSPESIAAAKSKWADSTPESLGRGRDLYLAKCNGCHGYPDLTAHEDSKLPDIVKEMAGKSDLSPADGELVLRFVIASKSH